MKHSLRAPLIATDCNVRFQILRDWQINIHMFLGKAFAMNSRLGKRLDLPLSAVDEYFRLSIDLTDCTDVNVCSALETLRMACTNLPIDRDAISSARIGLVASLETSACARTQQALRHANCPKGGGSSHLEQSKMHEVLPGLFVGSYHPANDAALLKSKQITHVCCCINVNGRFPDIFRYLILAADDSSGFNIYRFFDESFSFIDEALSSGNGVLVHCGAGISRAPTIAAAYIMRKLGVSAMYAMQLIASVRTCACPNMGFQKQLQQLERELASGGVASAVQC